MSFLLKIVQGPNAGAEIALVEGATISVGRGEACDIILNDAALGEKAFDIEVSDERVMLIFPNGQQQRLDEYHVKTIGTTSLVMGPAEGVWKEIIWPASQAAVVAVSSSDDGVTTASGGSDEDSSGSEPSVKDEKTGKKRRGLFSKILWLTFFVLFLILVGVIVFWHFSPETVSTLTSGKSDKVLAFVRPHALAVKNFVVSKYNDLAMSDREKKAIEEALHPREKLDDVAKELNLTLSTNKVGIVKVAGDFKTRSDRLKAIGRVYRAKSGVQIDFTDADSLKTTIEGVISLFEGLDVRVASIDGRDAFLEGNVKTLNELKNLLDAIKRDVTKVKKTDVSKVLVALGNGVVATKNDEISGETKVLSPAPAGEVKTATIAPVQPNLPVVGILTAPYPCLVLQSGVRIMEGAKFGDFVVDKITSESIELSGANGTFTWKP